MKTVILLRHGHSAANAKNLLTGRLPGVGLSPEGKKQSLALVERIGAKRIEHLHLSPIERCQLTIGPWLSSKNSNSLLTSSLDDGFSEIDFGRWSGEKLSTLRRDPLWSKVQNEPSRFRFPGGESFREAQKRAVSATEGIRSKRGTRTHLVVSHSDTIKLILAHYSSMKLDSFQSLKVDPASFTVMQFDRSQVRICTINNRGALKEMLS